MLDKIKIGFATMQKNFPDDKIASTRIRVTWPVKYMEPGTAIIDGDFEETNAVIFQSRYSKQDIEKARQLKAQGIKIILDLTDPEWAEEYSNGAAAVLIDEFLKIADCATFPTPYLRKEFLKKWRDIPTEIIKDRLDLEQYCSIKIHKEKQEYKIHWHGSRGNLASIELAREDLEELGKKYKIKLICVYDHIKSHPIKQFNNIELEAREWSERETQAAILESDVGINPRFDNWKQYKSNNKTITAWACGVEAIENNFYNEIDRLLKDASLRNYLSREHRTEVEAEYNVKQTAQDWQTLVIKLLEDGFTQIKKRQKIAVLTSITAGYDNLKETGFFEPGVDYFAFIDKPTKSAKFKTKLITNKFIEPIRNAKQFKVLPHKFLYEYQYTIWMDGSLELKVPASELIKYLKDADIAVFKHAARSCPYAEFEADISYTRRREPKHIREAQRARYIKEGLPKNIGLYEMGAFIKKNTREANDLFNEWWAEISAASHSDQVSFIYAAWKHPEAKITILPGNVYNNQFFKYTNHNAEKAAEIIRYEDAIYKLIDKGPEQIVEPIPKVEPVPGLIMLIKKTPGNMNFIRHGTAGPDKPINVPEDIAAGIMKDYPGVFEIKKN